MQDTKALLLLLLSLIAPIAYLGGSLIQNNEDQMIFVDSSEALPPPPYLYEADPKELYMGLTNQKIGYATAISVSQQLHLTLVLQDLRAYLDQDIFLAFDEVFDYDFFHSVTFPDAPTILEKQFETLDRSAFTVASAEFLGREPLKDYPKHYGALKADVISFQGRSFTGQRLDMVNMEALVYPAMQPAPDLEARVRLEIDRIESEDRMYIGVHLRVEKDWETYRFTKKEPFSTSEQIEELVHWKYGGVLENVFLAVGSDVSQSPFPPWEAGGWRVHTTEFDSAMPYIAQSVVDYEILLRADVFFGVQGSTFSQAAIRERCYRNILCGCEQTNSNYLVHGARHGPTLIEAGCPNITEVEAHPAALNRLRARVCPQTKCHRRVSEGATRSVDNFVAEMDSPRQSTLLYLLAYSVYLVAVASLYRFRRKVFGSFPSG
eukprot:Rmarinus@m.25330